MESTSFSEANYFVHDPNNETGFGGRTFTVKTADGPKAFKGPWSSRCSVINREFGEPHIVEVTIKLKADTGGIAGSMLVIEAIDWAACAGGRLIADPESKGRYYIPK